LFYLDNDAFGGVDPHIYYCILRHFRPRTVVEIGSGFSTLLGAQASERNSTTRYICVDPWPRSFVGAGIPGVEHIQKRVEELDAGFFEQLQEGDVLFIDSSHVVRTAGDVCFLVLDVLPRLASGVIIHFHDIYLPFDYPDELIIERQMFWTEQYLLQAYIADNSRVEVLFATNFVACECPEELQRVFPRALWWGGGSFWMRKR
jgi:hypothetical protein